MDDERPPSLWWGMWKRFLIGGVLIVLLSGAATATVALNTVSGIAAEVFPKLNQINAPKGVVTPVYSGGPQTFLILGSDRRARSKSVFDRNNPPHSDTILLVRFDPEQGQTSVLSIPRDLQVNITASKGQYYPNEKINAAYTIGSRQGGVRGGMVLAAETIEHQVFPGLKLAGIVDVNFAGFINVVDSLGCVYVEVDHRYYHVNNGGPEENYSEINLQPGYQKLCYQSALSYVRYRHTDSDFVRVARQQDFMRDLREQISPEDVIGQIDTVAKAVGHAISSTFHDSASELIELAKLVAFSQGKPLRQVKFRTANVNALLKGGSYVTTTPALAEATLNDFLHGAQKLSPPISSGTSRAGGSSVSRHGRHNSGAGSPAAIGLYPTSSAGQSEAVRAAVNIPFRVLYPSRQTGPAVQQTVRAYDLPDQNHHLHHAYVIVWQQNGLGGYYNLEGTDWLNPPLIAHPDETRKIAGRSYMLFSDGGHLHAVAWRVGRVLYWLTNTLLEDLTNEQMLGIARSAQPLH
jgi:polyisoprenyl-teichoic acid--peptidoglycan teichoic acid transferase